MKFKPKIFFLVIFLILLFSKSSYPANFSDITSTNLPAISDFSLGAVAVDADKDGDFDIFVANNGQDRLLLNNSSGVSSDAAFGKLAGPSGDLFLVIISSISDSSKAIKILRDNNKTAFVDETSSR